MHSHIAALARRQHGVVHRRQLMALGRSVDAINGMLRRGHLDRLATAVYGVAGAPDTPLRRAMVAALRCGPGSIVVGVPMLAHQGVDGLGLGDRLEVLVPRGRRFASLDWPVRTAVASGRIPRADVAGVPSLVPAGNLIEVAAGRASDARVVEVVDRYRWSRRSMKDVAELARSLPDHVGARRLVALGCLDADAAESSPERELELMLAPYGYERQVELAVGIRVDFLIRSAALIVEYDGAGHVTADDQARDARSRRLGYLTLRVRAPDMHDRRALRARIARYVEAGRARSR